ncbi:MAG: DinB family protein [Candidatus Dormibacteraeota bacterium]|nr:DinB family protein [Candidatus Dormibacteraeota bacterium]
METSAAGRPDEVVVLMAMVPEQMQDLVLGLDEPRLDYRHAPAFPTLKEVIGHLCAAGTRLDALLRGALLEGAVDVPLRDALDPPHEPDLSPPLAEMLAGFGRDRRRTVELLRGLSEREWVRSVSDPRQGDLTLHEVGQQINRHELGHLAQLRNLVAVLPE